MNAGYTNLRPGDVIDVESEVLRTVCIQIGNSDDKLTQVRWSFFVAHIDDRVKKLAARVHFGGYSSPAVPWQNACWVAEVAVSRLGVLRQLIREAGKAFDQDSVAWLEGLTEFV